MNTTTRKKVNLDILSQVKLLDEIITGHQMLSEVIIRTESLELNNYYHDLCSSCK